MRTDRLVFAGLVCAGMAGVWAAIAQDAQEPRLATGERWFTHVATADSKDGRVIGLCDLANRSVDPAPVTIEMACEEIKAGSIYRTDPATGLREAMVKVDYRDGTCTLRGAKQDLPRCSLDTGRAIPKS